MDEEMIKCHYCGEEDYRCNMLKKFRKNICSKCLKNEVVKKITTLECGCRFIVIGDSINERDRGIVKDQDWYCKECEGKLYLSEMEVECGVTAR